MSECDLDQHKECCMRRKAGYEATDTAESSVGVQRGLTSPRRRHARISGEEIDDIEHVIEKLPNWENQLTLRGFIAGEQYATRNTSSSLQLQLQETAYQNTLFCSDVLSAGRVGAAVVTLPVVLKNW